jgi:pimeloyl-ACP methyl ester carboxylesterase
VYLKAACLSESQMDLMLQPQVLYSDDNVKISFQPGNGTLAVISFTGIGLQLGGIQQEEFRASLNGDRDIYYVTDHQRSWFNDCFQSVVDVVSREITARGTKEVTTLGNSMGGFGALLFAAYLPNCRTAIAFAPQSSIKSDVVPFESRYRKFAAQVRTWNVPDVVPHLLDSVRYHVVIGADEPIDEKHADRLLASNISGLNVYSVKNADHNVARSLKSQGISLHKLIAAMYSEKLLTLQDFDTNLAWIRQSRNPPSKEDPGPMAKIEDAYRNDIEIQVFGLQRSGNHGVISWLLQQYDTPVVFLNNVTQFTDPFRNWHAGAVANMMKVSHNQPAQLEMLRASQKNCLSVVTKI